MIAREAVLNDPEIVQLLRERFVCLAVDNANNLNLTPADREWLKDRGGRSCTQGMTVFTAGGELLGSGGGFEPGPVKRMLEAGLKKFRPEEAVKVEDTGKDALPRPPEGGLVLTVTWKVLPGARTAASPTSGETRYVRTFLDSLGVDRLWVRKDEAAALAAGQLPDSLRRRMAPHLRHVLPGGLKTDRLQLRDGKLTGSYVAKGGDAAPALGFVESRGGKVTRFELVVKGVGVRARDFGFSAGLTVVAPDARAPVALAFLLADPGEDLTRLPPFSARARDYLK